MRYGFGPLMLGFLTLGVVLALVVGGLILNQMRTNDPEGFDRAVTELAGGRGAEETLALSAAGEAAAQKAGLSPDVLARAYATAAWLDKAKGPGSGDAALYATLTGGESSN